MKDCPPFIAIKNLKKEYPNAFKYADMIHQDMCKWDPSFCYINISAAQACISGGETLKPHQYSDAQLLAALSTWRRDKNVYTFDLSLINELTENFKDLVIPVEILRQLPENALYIDTQEWNSDFCGFMVYWDDDHITHKKELRFLYLDEHGKPVYNSYIHLLDNGTVHDGLENGKQMMLENMRNQQPSISFYDVSKVLKSIDANYELVCNSMQLVLFLCAKNSVMLEDPEQAKIYRPGSVIADKFREVRMWNVQMKKSETCMANDDTKEGIAGSRKRPHIRHAHWHYFWTGSNDDRKLVLHWIDDIYIHEDDISSISTEEHDKTSKSLLN